MVETTSKLNLENVCFEGGGIRGLVYVGIFKYLEEKRIKFKKFCGSSAGSIFSGLLACNASYDFVNQKVKNTNFNYFLDGWGGSLGKLYRFYYYQGEYNGDYFYNWYGEILKELTGNSDITLLEIYHKYNNDIIITGSCISERRLYFFTKELNPDMPLRLAVRISMSIPLLFKPIIYNGKVWVDGGDLDNYPVDYHFESGKTIGFKLQASTDEIPNYQFPINGASDFITNLLESNVEQIERLREAGVISNGNLNTIEIPTFEISSTDFNINNQNIQKLIESGYSAIKESGLFE